MKALVLLAIATAIAACGKSVERTHLSSLTFDVPVGWGRALTTEHGLLSAVWTPSPADNTRKESIAVVRSERSPMVATSGGAAIARLLDEAQRGLPDAQASEPVPVKTKHGLSGFQVTVDYVPPGLHDHYHRVHVVLVDGAVLVHVLYTARTPDPDPVALKTVLDTIREGKG